MRRLLAAALLVFAALSGCAGVALTEGGVRGRRQPVAAAAAAAAHRVAGTRNAHLATIDLDRPDGVRLRAWHFTRRAPSRGTVLVTHGVSSNRADQIALAALLLDADYDVLAPDARGHGDSAGLATYGVLEAGGIVAWADEVARLRPDGGRGRCLFAVGASLGAAQTLLAEAARPGTFCAIVADSAFTTLVDAALDRIARRIGVGETAGRLLGRPVAFAGGVYADFRYGIDFRAASPIDRIAGLAAPILLIHGGADLDTPVWHALALAAAQPRAELWVVPGAAHVGSWRAAPRAYPERIVSFLRRHG